MGIVMAEAARLQPTATCPCKQKRPTKGACEEDAGVACFQPKVNSSASLTHHLLRLCLGPSASSRVSAVPFSPIAAASPPVRAVGTNFMLGSGVVYPSGTSWYAEEMYDLQAKE